MFVNRLAVKVKEQTYANQPLLVQDSEVADDGTGRFLDPFLELIRLVEGRERERVPVHLLVAYNGRRCNTACCSIRASYTERELLPVLLRNITERLLRLFVCRVNVG